MAVESVFTALNMRTALRLAEVRGVVLLAAEQHGVGSPLLFSSRSKSLCRRLRPRRQKTDATDGARPF